MSKEIKRVLKEARDAIKAKDYTTCIKLCKVLNDSILIFNNISSFS